MYVLPDFKVDPIKTQFLYWTSFFFLSVYINNLFNLINSTDSSCFSFLNFVLVL